MRPHYMRLVLATVTTISFLLAVSHGDTNVNQPSADAAPLNASITRDRKDGFVRTASIRDRRNGSSNEATSFNRHTLLLSPPPSTSESSEEEERWNTLPTTVSEMVMKPIRAITTFVGAAKIFPEPANVITSNAAIKASAYTKLNIPNLALDGLRIVLDAPKVALDAPKVAQDAPKIALDAPKAALDGLKIALDAPKAALDAPKVAQDAPQIALDAPKIALDAPKAALDAPKAALDAPEAALDAPKATLDAPKVALDAPKAALDAPKATLDASKATLDAPKVALDAPEIALDAPKAALDAPKATLDTPKVALDAPEIALDAPTAASEITLDAPKIALHTPEIALDAPNALSKSTRNKSAKVLARLRSLLLKEMSPELAVKMLFLKNPKIQKAQAIAGIKKTLIKIPGAASIMMRLKLMIWYHYRVPPTYVFKELGLVGKGTGDVLHRQPNYKYFKSYFDKWHKSQRKLES